MAFLLLNNPQNGICSHKTLKTEQEKQPVITSCLFKLSLFGGGQVLFTGSNDLCLCS